MCVTPLQWERDSNRCECLYYNRCEPYCRSALCLKLILIVHSLHTPYPNKQTHAHTHTHTHTNTHTQTNKQTNKQTHATTSTLPTATTTTKNYPLPPPPATRTQCIHTLASGNRDQRSGEQKWRPTFPSTQGDLIPNHFALTQSLTHTDTHTHTQIHTHRHARTHTDID